MRNDIQGYISPTTIRGFYSDTRFAWSLVEMQELVTLHYGKALTAGDRREGNVPVYGTNGITGWHDEPLGIGPTVILGRKGMGNLGVEWCSGSFWVIDTAYYTTFDESRLDAEFFYYFTNFVGLNHLKDGTSNPSLTRDRFARQLIPLPAIEEQRDIVQVLRSLDDKIEANRRQNETLEATARAIFKSWFVDFDSVHAKARGEHPPGMDEATVALFPDSFEESELGLIPCGWQVLPLDHIADYLNGLAMQKYPADGADYLPVIKIRELRQGFTDDKSGQASTEIDSKYIVEDGDVIFSWSGSLLVDIWTGGIGGLNQHLFKVTSNDFPRWFYYFWTKYHLEEFQRIAASKATTMGHIKRSHLREALVVVPSDNLLQMAHSMLEPMIEKLIGDRLQSRTLAETRDVLLPRLVSGELRVGEL